MRCPTTHETKKRTRTMHLRIATFSTQRGPWRSTHHGFHSYEHQTWKAVRKPSKRPCTSSGCTPSIHPVATPVRHHPRVGFSDAPVLVTLQSRVPFPKEFSQSVLG